MYINYLILDGKFFKRQISSAHKFTYDTTDYKMWRNIIKMLKQGAQMST